MGHGRLGSCHILRNVSFHIVLGSLVKELGEKKRGYSNWRHIEESKMCSSKNYCSRYIRLRFSGNLRTATVYVIARLFR